MRAFTLKSYKFLFLLVFVIALFSIFVVPSKAQETTEDLTKKYGVQFPITELGNCNDYSECRTYCTDPVNAGVCTEYAKKKGFYKEDSFDKEKEKVIEIAKKEFGCDSEASCMNFCEIPTNYDKCDVFAKKNAIKGGVVENPGDKKILEKAKSILGCDSENTCKSVCEKEENRDKCNTFARESGLRGGEQRVGPGGCTSEATCKAFCSAPESYQVCSGFISTSGGTFTGPGGCNSEESCRTYCKDHENECRAFGGDPANPGREASYNPAEACNRTPNCSWTNNGCQCGLYGETRESQNKAKEYAEFCQSNPDKCKVGPGGYPIPEEKLRQFSTMQGSYQNYGDYCKKNPERCKVETVTSSSYREDPEAACLRYNCIWTNNRCQCLGISYNNSTDNNLDRAAQGCSSAGGKWQGNYCEMPTGSSNSSGMNVDRAAEGCRSVGGSWMGNWCKMPLSVNTSSSGVNDSNNSDGTARASEGCGRAGGTWMGNWCKMPDQSGTPGGSGGSERYYSGGHPGGPGAPFPGESSSGGGAYGGGYDASGNYVGGSYGGYDSAGKYVGTGSSGGSTSTSTQTQTTTQTQPQPTQESQPAPQPVQESQPTQQSDPAPAPAPAPDSSTSTTDIQGVSTAQNVFQSVVNAIWNALKP